MGIFLDLTDDAAIDRAVDEVVREFGHIDCVVLNSGGPPPGQASEIDCRELAAAMEGILYPAQTVIRKVLPGMVERGWGRIVAIGSSGVEQPIPGLAASNAARAALAALLKTLASEVGRSGVTVNMVIPGRFATDRVRALDMGRAAEQGISVDDVRERSSAAIPVGRYGDPSELAALVAFLCSPEASYITGTLLRADGGLVACIG
jgi:3-oxoacyl-[acyl-carrier protein] reductase